MFKWWISCSTYFFRKYDIVLAEGRKTMPFEYLRLFPEDLENILRTNLYTSSSTFGPRLAVLHPCLLLGLLFLPAFDSRWRSIRKIPHRRPLLTIIEGNADFNFITNNEAVDLLMDLGALDSFDGTDLLGRKAYQLSKGGRDLYKEWQKAIRLTIVA